ncbi:MAG: hypothetical protein NT105_18115 [Verrucomicrobia bacterium]|nr:hypothetical protein [Verrucomicrobiota bacterium]
MSHHKSDDSHKPPAVRHLPDPAICRAEIVKQTGLVKCLVDSPQDCVWAVEYGGTHHCGHPDRHKFVAHTAAEKRAKKA